MPTFEMLLHQVGLRQFSVGTAILAGVVFTNTTAKIVRVLKYEGPRGLLPDHLSEINRFKTGLENLKKHCLYCSFWAV